MTIGNLYQNAYMNFKRMEGKQPAPIEICRIEEVDTKNKLVSAYFFSTNTVATNVPYCLPFYNAGYGIIFAPSKGALGIAAWDYVGKPYILTFTVASTVDNMGKETRELPNLGPANMPELLSGEVLAKSSGHSFLKLDKLGGFMLSNAIFASVAIDENGDYSVNVENAVLTMNGLKTEKYLIGYQKYMEVVTGLHETKTSQDADNSIELCYEIRVGDRTVFGVTPEGKVITSQEEEYEKRIRRKKGKRVNSKGTARRYNR